MTDGDVELVLVVTAPAITAEELHYLDRLDFEHGAIRHGLDPQERELVAQAELELERRILGRP